ncbi:unnamed protein product [Paramecium sonneborni]|uniref:G-protein coupled receptors family 2 profile 2 domain-containing protein n=1 Tax=Paramecium sonneborni TaxID=65129 RepID=A0A8S1NPA2_9CILI|nr:unnamed protein product [Paramecium sonneborni]
MESIFGNNVSHRNQIALQDNFAYSVGQKVVNYSIKNDEQQNFLMGQAQVNSILISRDGNHIFTGEQSFKSPAINIYQIKDQKIIQPTHRLIGHKFGIKQILESPIKPFLLSLGTESDKTLFLWDLQYNKSLSINKLENKVNSIRFSKKGTILISAGQSHLQYWQFRQDGYPIFEGQTLQSNNFSLFEQFTSKNYIDCFVDDQVYVCTSDALLCIFSLATKQMLSYMQLDLEHLYSLTFNGTYFFFGSSNSKIQICDFELQNICFLTQNHQSSNQNEYDCLGIEANDVYLISAYRNKNIAIWNITNINKIEQVRVLHSHSNLINHLIVLKPQSIYEVSFVATISEQDLVIWHTNTNSKKIKKLNLKNNVTYTQQFQSDFQYNELRCLSQSNDGQYLAIGDTYGLMRIFSLINFKQIAQVQAHTLKITVIQYWVLNSSFMTGSDDKTIAIYDKLNFKNYNLLSHHTDSILNIFTYQNKIITYSKDKLLVFLEYSEQNFQIYYKSQLSRISSIDQDQNFLFILQDGIVSVIDILQSHQKFILNIQDCLKLRISHQESYCLLATVSYNKVTLYKYVNENNYKKQEELDLDNIVMIEFANNNSHLIVITKDANTIIIWQIKSVTSSKMQQIQSSYQLQQKDNKILNQFWQINSSTSEYQQKNEEELGVIKFDSESEDGQNEPIKIISETPRLDLLAITLGTKHATEIKKQLNEATQQIQEQVQKKQKEKKQEEQDLLHNSFYEEQKSMQEFHKQQNSKIIKRQLMKKTSNLELEQNQFQNVQKIDQSYIIKNSIAVPNQSQFMQHNQIQKVQYDKMPILDMDIKRVESNYVMKNIQQSFRNQSKFQISFSPENSIMLNCSYNFTERKQDDQNNNDENLLYQNQQISIAKCHLKLIMIALSELIENLNLINKPIKDQVLKNVDKDLETICSDIQDIRQVDCESVNENLENPEDYIQNVVNQCSKELFENYVQNLLNQMHNNIPVIFCSSLSLIGQVLIVLLFVYSKKLREGLIPRIILYLTISGIIQTIGILCSSFENPKCTIFATFRLYGGLSSLVWSSILIYSIKQLFMVLSQDSILKDTRQIFDQLCSQENKFLICAYGIPMMLMIYPITTAIILSESNTKYCLYYHKKKDSSNLKAQLDIQKLLFWIIPICLYLCYSFTLIKNIKQLLAEDDDKKELYWEVKKLIKQIFLFPTITLICTLSFTVEDIQSIFSEQIGSIQTTISFIFLSFWGFLNCIAYLSQEPVKQQITEWFKINQQTQQQNFRQQSSFQQMMNKEIQD